MRDRGGSVKMHTRINSIVIAKRFPIRVLGLYFDLYSQLVGSGISTQSSGHGTQEVLS
jgi:hypothetical protein